MEKKVPVVSDPSSLSRCLLVLDGSRIFGLVSDDDWHSSVAFFFVSIAILLEIFRADSLRQAV